MSTTPENPSETEDVGALRVIVRDHRGVQVAAMRFGAAKPSEFRDLLGDYLTGLVDRWDVTAEVSFRPAGRSLPPVPADADESDGDTLSTEPASNGDSADPSDVVAEALRSLAAAAAGGAELLDATLDLDGPRELTDGDRSVVLEVLEVCRRALASAGLARHGDDAHTDRASRGPGGSSVRNGRGTRHEHSELGAIDSGDSDPVTTCADCVADGVLKSGRCGGLNMDFFVIDPEHVRGHDASPSAVAGETPSVGGDLAAGAGNLQAPAAATTAADVSISTLNVTRVQTDGGLFVALPDLTGLTNLQAGRVVNDLIWRALEDRSGDEAEETP